MCIWYVGHTTCKPHQCQNGLRLPGKGGKIFLVKETKKQQIKNTHTLFFIMLCNYAFWLIWEIEKTKMMGM